MRKLKKIVLYGCGGILIFIILLVSSAYYLKDNIINQVIRETNKNLNTPIQIGNVDISWFEDFPNLSIVFKEVSIEDSHPEVYPLLTADMISFQLNLTEVWKKNYTIKGLRITNAQISLRVAPDGTPNYTIFKSDAPPQKSAVAFKLKNVKLFDVGIAYRNESLKQDFIFFTQHLTTSLYTEKDIYYVDAQGDVTTRKLNIQHQDFFTGKSFKIDGHVIYDDIRKNLNILSSEIGVRNASFTILGNYNWKLTPTIELEAKAQNTDIQTLISLLPEKVAIDLEKYRSKGETYFNARLKGPISPDSSPHLSIDFGFKNATLYHPEYRSEITQASMTGSFASSHFADPRQAVLILKEIKGVLNDRSFEAELSVHNLEQSEVQCAFKGEIDAQSIFEFFPFQGVKQVTGLLNIDIFFAGKLEWLKQKATASKTSTKGKITLKNLSADFTSTDISLKNINGTLHFSNNDLALSNVSGVLGNSDFLLNGFFKNAVSYFLFEDQPIGIETDLKSQFLDIDQLLVFGFGAPSESGSQEVYAFTISPRINLNFNCDVKFLRYKKFSAKNAKGDLLVKNQVAVSRKIELETMGGKLALSGIVDTHDSKNIDVVSSCKLNGLYLDSIFYVFENFRQDFIQDKHLKGQVVADVDLEMVLNPELKLYSETLLADMSVIIKNGALNNFEPIQRLGKFLDDRSLHQVRFSDLKNDIHIKDNTVYIPQMDVSTNITSMRISGTHTFNQLIDYRVITPLKNYHKINKDEARNALEDLGEGRSKLYLRIKGSTDNYRVIYDTESVKKKITQDIKDEVTELKEIFKNKGPVKDKVLELEEDEYFEWDESEQ